jgi:hypothetical protein
MRGRNVQRRPHDLETDSNDHGYFNNIAFADHRALLDPPIEDVTARCRSMLAQLGEAPASPVMQARLTGCRNLKPQSSPTVAFGM